MDYGIIAAPVREYLHDMIGSTPPEVSDEFTAFMDLYSRKFVRRAAQRIRGSSRHKIKSFSLI